MNIEALPKLDAVLVHGHGYGQKPERDHTHFPRPSIRGHMSQVAASALFTQGKTDNIVYAGFPTFGHKIPLAEVNAKEFRKRTGLPDNAEQVYINATARTSAMEQEFLKQKTKEQEWKHVGLLTVNTHLPRVKKTAHKVFDASGIKYYPLSTEEVLKTLEPEKWQRYQRVIKKLNRSFDELRFKTYEFAAQIIMCFPKGEKLLNSITKFWRPKVT